MSVTSDSEAKNQLEAEHLRLILDAVPEFIVYIGADERYRFVNRVYEELYSRRSEEILGRSLREVIGEDAYARARPDLARAFRGERVRYVTTISKPGRETIWVQITIVPDFSPEGVLRGVLVSGQDVSAEKRMEAEKGRLLAEVQRREAELKAMLGSMVYGVVMYSELGKPTYFNDSVERIMGMARSELESMSNEERVRLWTVSNEDGTPITVDELPSSRALRGEPVRSLVQRWHVNGRTLFLSINASPVVTPDGDRIGAVVSFSDVSEQRRMAEELAENERRFRLLADSLPQMVCTAGPDGNLAYYNERWYEFTGFERSISGRKEWKALLHPEDASRCFESYDEAIRRGNDYQVECRLRDRFEERYRWFLIRAVPVRTKSGGIAHWFGTCTDIDDQKRAAQDAESALQTRDEFMSMASHELKTPLTTLMLQAQLAKRFLKQKDGDPAMTLNQVQTFMSYIEDQVLRLNRLVEDMLNVSRISSGKLRVERTAMDLAAVVNATLDQLKPMLTQAGCPLTLDVRGSINGSWDSFRIEQVVTNLVTNAARYGAGSPVAVRAFSGAEGAVLIVEDQGPGIAAEDHERIFNRFEQTAAGLAAKGLGLGLYITRQIVEMHGGSISIQSSPGNGARFTVTLPRE